MGVIVKPNIFTTGQLPSGPQWDTNFQTLYDCINGNISASNLLSASCTTSKFVDGIITAGKLTTDIDFSNTQEFCFQEASSVEINTGHTIANAGQSWNRADASYVPHSNATRGATNNRNGYLLFFRLIGTWGGSDIVMANNSAGFDTPILTMAGDFTTTVGATTMSGIMIASNVDGKWVLLSARNDIS